MYFSKIQDPDSFYTLKLVWRGRLQVQISHLYLLHLNKLHLDEPVILANFWFLHHLISVVVFIGVIDYLIFADSVGPAHFDESV